jgi:hypothetical protein
MTILIEGPDGVQVEFPDETPPTVMRDAMRRKFGWQPPVPAGNDKPAVPLYVDNGQGGEINVNANPQARGQFDAIQKAQDEAKAQEQAKFDASRTPLTRLQDAAAFATSMPIRLATQGDYGLGDVTGDQSAAQAEANFIRANQGKSALETGNPGDILSLSTLKDVGDIGIGIPGLSELGAVPGEFTKVAAANAKAPIQAVKQGVRDVAGAIPQAVRDYAPSSETVQRLASEDVGAGKLPGAAGDALTQAQLLKQGAWSTDINLLKQSLDDFQSAPKRFADNPAALQAAESLQAKTKAIIDNAKSGDFSGAPALLQSALGDAAALEQAAPGSNSAFYTQWVKSVAKRQGISAPGISESVVTPRRALENKSMGAVRRRDVEPAAPAAASSAAELPPAATGEGGTKPPLPPVGVEPPPAPPSPPSPPSGGEPPAGQPFAFKTAPNKDQVLDAAERLGIDIPEAVVAKPANQQIAAGIQGIPGGGKIKAAIEKGVEDLGARHAEEVNKLGSPGIESAGEGAKTGVLNWIGSTSKKEANALYEGLDSLIDPNVKRPLKATASVDAEFKSRMQESTAPAQAKAREMVSEALARPEGLTVQGLRDLRTHVGDQLDWANLNSDPSKGSLKRLYGALTQDLRAAVQKAGGNGALSAFDRSEAEYTRIAGVRQELQKIVGVKGDVGEEAVVNKVLTMPLSRLQQMRKVLGEEHWGDIAAEIASRMGLNKGTGQFSHDRYLTAYGKMSEARKQLLFGESKRAFDDIALVATKFNELTSKFNRSNTAYANFVIGLLTNLNKSMVGAAQVAGGVGAILGGAPGAGVGALMPYVGKGAGMAAIRRVSSNLARPAVANRAARVAKSLYNVESASAFDRGARAIASKEATLQASIKAYAATLARETGQSADDIERQITTQIQDLRSKK